MSPADNDGSNPEHILLRRSVHAVPGRSSLEEAAGREIYRLIRFEIPLVTGRKTLKQAQRGE